MDDDYESEALFFEGNGGEHEETKKNGTPSDEQILNDLLKKDKQKNRKQRVVTYPKLRDIEICGPNGFLELKRSFDSYTPKNKNPYDDLLVMMSRIEQWGHRLCPKMTFEDFMTRVESLSAKRMVKTMLTKMRLDMPLTDEDFLGNKENEQQEFANTSTNDVDDMDLFELFNDLPSEPVASHQTTSPPEFSGLKLSSEQLQRIEENKRRAQKLRMQREKRVNHLNYFDSVVENDDAPVCSETTNNMPLTQDEDLGKPDEHLDIMMDDDEALDFIFSTT
ncbi:unnamed protein product [Litomosoides sigmodontis]|uniref:TIMELESS-interacting protein n=1 Tax=Litomosoides sigmodontis TaxID=42156 RepID=A0A3P6V0X3_LITSI|nr:unnamed protein product [Litomosoides sigmodontis]